MIYLQDPIVMAFRKRMKSCGYTDITIYKMSPFNGFYRVSAVEPLSKAKVSVKYDLCDMHNAFRF